MNPAWIAWRDALGSEQVLPPGDASMAPYLPNVSGLARRVGGVLKPGTTEEVRRIVEIANEHRIPLYPISAGGNWGLGSKLPPRDDAVIVDLRRMNRIHEINVAHNYAIVEPGVTQGQLYDHLQAHNIPLAINVTGSGRNTSLIGNALERGIGYFSSRADALSGLEVVLGNGQVVRTGFGQFPDSRMTHIYRHGIGPDLAGLFAQSNFGIVTRAGFELMPRPETQASVIVKIADESQFIPFFDALVALRRRGVMRTIWHLGNRNRSEIALGPLVFDQLTQAGGGTPAERREAALQLIAREGFGPWNAVGGLMGSRAMLKVMRAEIKATLKGLAQVEFLDDARIAKAKRVLGALSCFDWARRKRIMLQAVEPLYGMSKGIPSDAALKSVCWPTGENVVGPLADPDTTHSGMIYVLPFFPLSGDIAREIIDEANRVFGQHGLKAYITLNFVDDRAAEAVINCAFDRRDTAQTDVAHRAVNELTERYITMGYPPYRVGIQHMDRIVDAENPFWKSVAAIKDALDPKHIIAPGRYNSI